MILLGGEKSNAFKVEKGMAQVSGLSPTLFLPFINDLLIAVKQVELGMQS